MIDYSEIILVLGAVVIFSLVALNTNRMLANHNRLLIEQELEYTAIAKGQELVDKARTLAFDETTTGGNEPGTIPDDFADPGNLGTAADSDAGGIFDDFDDYNNYSASDTTGNGVFNITAQVMYVTENNPETNAGTETRHKYLNVTVSSPYLSNNINVTYVKTYY